MYIGAGGLATGTHYAITIAAVEGLGLAPLAATAVGFAAGAMVKYWLNYSLAFRSNAAHGRALTRFAVMLALFWALNAAIFAAIHALGVHYLAAQVATTILLVPPGYLMSRLWVFRAC